MAKLNREIFQILSLSGGGVRGLYTITVLAELEQHLADEFSDENYWIGKHFDLICGTSIGGILALGLANGQTARELLEILDLNRKEIFPFKSRLTKIFKRPYQSLYTTTPLRKVLQKAYKGKIIGDLKARVLVPAVNYTTGSVQVFKTPHHIDFRNDWKLTLVDVGLATSAAPTFFPIHTINDSRYVDGGLAANSPALMGFHEVRQFLGDSKTQTRVLVVGTMGQEKTADHNKKLNAGYVGGWSMGKALVELTLSANEGLHNQILRHLLSEDSLLEIDDSATSEQSKNLDLDNASDVAASVLKGRAKERAKKTISEPIFKNFIKHQAPKPTFFYGSNKTTR